MFRPFGSEMVLLNLQTGQYHGLNHSGSRMLEVLAEVGDFDTAAGLLATEFAHPVDEISADLSELCQALAERALVEIDGRPPSSADREAGSAPDG